MRNESLFFSPKRVLYSAVMVSALLCGGNIQTHAEALHAQAVMQTVTVKGQVSGPYWSTSYWCQCARKGNFQRGNY